MPTLHMMPQLSTRMAENLLHAWTSGDAARVEAEVQRSLSISTDVEDVWEQERRYVLHAVAVKIRVLLDVPRWGDPALEVCSRLLGHLVSPS